MLLCRRSITSSFKVIHTNLSSKKNHKINHINTNNRRREIKSNDSITQNLIQQSASGSNSASCSVSSNVGGDSIRNATDGLIDNVSDNPSNQQQQQQQPELRSQSSEEEATTLSQLQPGQRIRSGSQYLVLEADSSFVFTGDSGLEQLASQLDNNNFWSDHSAAEDYDSQVVQNSAHYDRAEPTVYGDSTSSVPKSPTHVVSRSMVSDSLLQELEMDTSPVVTMELSAKGIHVVNPEPENILETGPQDSEMDGSTGVVSPSEGIVQTTVEESNATSTVPLATESGAEPESKLTTVDAQPVLILSATLLPLSSSSGRKPQNHEVHIQSSQGSTPIEKDLSQTNISSNVTDSTARPSQSPSHPAVNYDPTTSKCEILECIEIPIRIRRPPSVRLRNASDEEAHGGHGRFVAGNSKKRRARDTGTAHELEWGCREETEDSELSPSPEASENASSRTKKFRTKDDSSYLEPASDASWDVDNVSVNDEEEDGEDDEVEEIEMILRGRRSSRLRANSHHTSPFTSLPQQNVMDSPSRNTRSSSAALQFSDVSVTHHGMDDSDDSDYRSPRQSSKNSNKKARRVSVASNPAKSPSVAKSAVSDEVTPDHGLRSNRFSSTPDSNSNNESQDHGQDSRDQSDVTRLRTIWHDKKIGWPLRHSKRGNAPVVVQPYSRDLVFGTALPLPCKN
ncbi:hypothetical protein BGZ83_010132 [Gryganskiella cystojenkinii]|nr:hypothetical protein BGZ83_010132 [Gryganskiella cystojenkinii]